MSFIGAVRAVVEIGKAAVVAAAIVSLLMNAAWAETISSPRPETWAQPVNLEGVPKLYRVSDALYRSEQPSRLGMKNLKQLGVKTFVNLRWLHSDRRKIGELDSEYEHIYMTAWHPEEKEVVRFLRIVSNPKRTPVLVHCHYGADRTGTMVAVYRIAMQGWSKEEAIREMTEGGFGFHRTWSNLPKWIQKLNIESLKRQAGIADIK